MAAIRELPVFGGRQLADEFDWKAATAIERLKKQDDRRLRVVARLWPARHGRGEDVNDGERARRSGHRGPRGPKQGPGWETNTCVLFATLALDDTRTGNFCSWQHHTKARSPPCGIILSLPLLSLARPCHDPASIRTDDHSFFLTCRLSFSFPSMAHSLSPLPAPSQDSIRDSKGSIESSPSSFPTSSSTSRLLSQYQYQSFAPISYRLTASNSNPSLSAASDSPYLGPSRPLSLGDQVCTLSPLQQHFNPLQLHA